MARRKQQAEEPEEILLSKQEVFDVLKVFQYATNFYPGIMTPDLINARMKDVSYNPLASTATELNNALANPKNSEDKLRSFVQYFELVSAPFKRVIEYLASLPALDLTYVAYNVADAKEFKSRKFQDDEFSVNDFVSRFDYYGQFRNVIRQLLRNEIYYFCVRDDGEKIVFQELPNYYCKLTGKWDYGYLFSFNLNYFTQSGVDIDLYPPFFKKEYIQWRNLTQSDKYDPTLPVKDRGNSFFNGWVHVPPDVGWVFKFDTSLTTSVPYLSAMMPDLIDQSLMRQLQKDINVASASKLLLGGVPLQKDQKSARVSDMIAISEETLGKFLALMKSAIGSAIKVAAAPLESLQPISFEGNDDLYNKYLKTSLASSGMSTSLIYTGELKANAIESQLSFESDEKILTQNLYPQFGAFMEYHANKNTKRYKWLFAFEGNAYYLDRKARFDTAVKAAEYGIVLPQKFAAAMGMRYPEFLNMLHQSQATGFVEKLIPIKSAFNSPTGEDASRPKKDDSELSESGAQTRDNGGNLARGGKI